MGEKSTCPMDPAAVPSPSAKERRSGPMTRAMAASTRENEAKATPKSDEQPAGQVEREGGVRKCHARNTGGVDRRSQRNDLGRAEPVGNRARHRHAHAPQQILDRQRQRKGFPRPAALGRDRLQIQPKARPDAEPNERDQTRRRNHRYHGNASGREICSDLAQGNLLYGI